MEDPVSVNQIFVKKLTDIVLANLDNEHFGVKELAREAGMSVYRLSRKLHSATKKKIIQFIREVRLQKALEILQTESYSVSEVAYKVGFSSPAYFNTCFNEYFGYTPGKVNKINLNSPGINNLTHDVTGNRSEVTRQRTHRLPWTGILFLALVLATVVFLLYKKFHKSEWTDGLVASDGRIPVVVMPFRNNTSDTIWNPWQDGIQECLITSLSKNTELKVHQKEIINMVLRTNGIAEYAAISPVIVRKVSKKFDAGIFIYGSINKSGSAVRVDLQLTSTKTGEVIKPFETDFSGENIFPAIDTLSKKLMVFLFLSRLIKENLISIDDPVATNSPDAWRYHIYGSWATNNARSKMDYSTAIYWNTKALEADSNFCYPYFALAVANGQLGRGEEDLRWVMKAYNKKDKWPLRPQLWSKIYYAQTFESPEKLIEYVKQFLQLDDQSIPSYYLLGTAYIELNQYDKAIPALEKALELLNKLDVHLNWYYRELGKAYHNTGQYKKEKKLYRKAEKYLPDDRYILARQAILSFSEKDSSKARTYIERLIAVQKSNFFSEADIAETLARIYTAAGILDKAEEYYRKSVSLEPENPERLNSIACFLRDNNRNVSDFEDIINKALALAPGKFYYCNYLDTKGWGLYKQGRYKEALEILQEVWNTAPLPLYTYKSHLEEAKKTVAGQM